jgi:hypothetical protein
MFKAQNLDELLNLEDTNASIAELADVISKECNYGDGIGSLTEPQKNFFYNQWLEMEINNGGFDQYFFNSSGEFAHETVVSLKLIGAHKSVIMLQTAIDQFSNGIVPKDRAERIGLMELIREGAEEIWSELDSRFFEQDEDLDKLNLDYIRINRELF